MNLVRLFTGIFVPFFATFSAFAYTTEQVIPLTLEVKTFAQDPLQNSQYGEYAALMFEPEVVFYSQDDSTIVKSKLFGRWDLRDDEATYFDIRELSYRKYFDNEVEVLAGISKVFWGVSESNHLVDIINQSDNTQPNRAYAKLGQPMIMVSKWTEYGNFSYYALPYFRERQFAGRRGRPSFGADINRVAYESSDRQKHLDHAFRFSKPIGIFDIGLSYFNGTSRDPFFDFSNGALARYDQISQFSGDFQATFDSVLLKTEVIHRTLEQDEFVAFVSGFEYTFYGLGESEYDLGLLTEYSKDDRDQSSVAQTIMQDDVFFGARLAWNDTANTSMLAGMFYDMEYESQLLSLEYETSINDDMKFEVYLTKYVVDNQQDLLYFNRRDANLAANLTYYF